MLTPIDIENKEFSKAFRGYDSIEVDEFMRSLILDYEKLYRENGALKEKNAIISETLENYKGMENTMQNAILVAQKTAEDIKQNAYERSNTITKEAEIKAGNIIREAEKRSNELEKEYSSLKKEMNTFKARMNSLLHTYLRLLEDANMGPQNSSALAIEDISDLERDIDKIQKKNQMTNVLNNDSDKEQTKEHVFKKTEAEQKNDFASKNDEKENVSSQNTYAPKKINPLVDELLKKRVSKEATEENDAKENENNIDSKKISDEIIIDFKKNSNKEYDVFKDETL